MISYEDNIRVTFDEIKLLEWKVLSFFPIMFQLWQIE